MTNEMKTETPYEQMTRIRKEQTYTRHWSILTHHPQDCADLAFLLHELDGITRNYWQLFHELGDIHSALSGLYALDPMTGKMSDAVALIKELHEQRDRYKAELEKLK